ncbi:MAG: MMPL family transporter [Chitinispirillaceae bacterium]|nr:MMPL family transporter [Chitinispirillaceae bacterium]
MRERFFRFLARLVTKHNKKVLLFCLFLTVVLVAVSGRLTMKTQIADMMPKGIPQIEEYMDIIDEYKSVMTVMLTIESDTKDVTAMKTCAEDLVSRLENITLYKPSHPEKMGLGQKIALMQGKYPIRGVVYDTVQLVDRIDYKVDNEFIEQSGMIIQKTRDLENMTTMYGSLELPALIRNINDNFEQEFIDDSENLSSIDGEAQAVQGLEGMRKFISSIGNYIASGDSAKTAEAIEAFIAGDQYFISPDNTMMLLMLHPAVSMEQFDDAMYLGYRIDDTLSVIQDTYPDLTLGRSGAMMIQIDENNTMAKDFGWSSVIALLLILLLLIGSFRTWKNPFYSVVTLAVALIWTTGLIALILHYINMMSASFGIILIGLGIDFGIHVISGFRDGREQGMSVEDAIFFMFNRSGAGIVTGAMTTAIVFFSLWLTGFEAYSEMGIAIGSGILTTLFAMLLLLPALIVWDNKGYSVTGNLLRKMHLGFIVNIWNSAGKGCMAFFRIPLFDVISRPLQFGFLNHTGAFVSKLPAAITIVLISGILAFLSIRSFSRIYFEYDISNTI